MAELVAHLERHGYVERVPDPADGRAKRCGRPLEVSRSTRSLAGSSPRRKPIGRGASEMERIRELREILEELNAAL